MPTDAYMAIEFAQSKGQARQEGKTGVKFGDVAGMDQTLLELQEIVEVKNCLRAFLIPKAGKTTCWHVSPSSFTDFFLLLAVPMWSWALGDS